MKQSTIQGLNVKNTPVQDFSINSSTDLTLDSIIIDNSAGNLTNGGHNTDAFDVGSPSGLLLRMRISRIRTIAWQSTLALTSHSPVVYAPVAMASASGPSVVAPITLSRTSTSVPHPSPTRTMVFASGQCTVLLDRSAVSRTRTLRLIKLPSTASESSRITRTAARLAPLLLVFQSLA